MMNSVLQIPALLAAADSHASSAPSLWAIAPFAAILLCIAVLPLLPKTAHWWESNRNRLTVSVTLASITLLYYLIAFDEHRVWSVFKHAILDEYIPFITVLFALYVISGGISLKGDLPAHPTTNTAFLAIGTLLASFIGTTGASMLLIRELLQTNSERKHVVHTVVFFIFLVSNVGGSLLPIGDPPLFLGYLQGVPFFWTLQLWKDWLLVSVALLIIYFIWDTIAYRREAKTDILRDETERTKLGLRGGINLVWLVLVVVCVAVVKPGEPLPVVGFTAFTYLRELLLFVLVGLSLITTDRDIRKTNGFNYHAILEVAALFIGIFITMQAPLELLRISGDSLRAIFNTPIRLFWGTGTLSAFLDNAPTYLVFMQLASAADASSVVHPIALKNGLFIGHEALIAISLGAVFMGAMTYIGNGPNFMVKSIAEQSGVKMPSFFGYMAYSVGVLVPLFILMTVLFL